MHIEHQTIGQDVGEGTWILGIRNLGQGSLQLDGFVYDHRTQRWAMQGVNVTLGLPIIRTSVDHGTAFGKAGKGTADQRSLLEAARFAIDLAQGSAA